MWGAFLKIQITAWVNYIKHNVWFRPTGPFTAAAAGMSHESCFQCGPSSKCTSFNSQIALHVFKLHFCPSFCLFSCILWWWRVSLSFFKVVWRPTDVCWNQNSWWESGADPWDTSEEENRNCGVSVMNVTLHHLLACEPISSTPLRWLLWLNMRPATKLRILPVKYAN